MVQYKCTDLDVIFLYILITWIKTHTKFVRTRTTVTNMLAPWAQRLLPCPATMLQRWLPRQVCRIKITFELLPQIVHFHKNEFGEVIQSMAMWCWMIPNLGPRTYKELIIVLLRSQTQPRACEFLIYTNSHCQAATNTSEKYIRYTVVS